jgi:hypothetical protein
LSSLKLTCEQLHTSYLASLHAQLASLAAVDLASLWQKYLDGFGNCIMDWVSDPESPAGRRLARMYREFSTVWSSMQIRQPSLFAVCSVLHRQSVSLLLSALQQVARVAELFLAHGCSGLWQGYMCHHAQGLSRSSAIEEVAGMISSARMYGVQQLLAHELQETLKHILQPAGASPGNMAAAAREDSCLAAGVRLSTEQKHMLVGLREALYSNLGRCAMDSVCVCGSHCCA